jgi:hypothetical protein
MLDGIVVVIGEKEYTIPVLNFKSIREMVKLTERMSAAQSIEERLGTMSDIVLNGLKRNYPELTKEEIEEQLDLDNFERICGIVAEQAGLKKKVTESAGTTQTGIEPTGTL